MQRLAYRPMPLARVSIIRIGARPGAVQRFGRDESGAFTMVGDRRGKIGEVDLFS